MRTSMHYLTHRLLKPVTLLLVTLAAALPVLAGPAPLDVVEKAQQSITSELAEYPELAGQSLYLKQLIDDHLLPATEQTMMFHRVMGSAASRASLEQTSAMMSVLRQRLIHDVAAVLRLYSTPSFSKTALVRGSGNKASVRATLKDDSQTSVIDYQLTYLGDWKITDISVDGQSLIDRYRKDTEKSIKAFGVAQTVAALAAEYQPFAQTVRLGAHAWGPYLATNLPNQGLAADIVRAAFQRTGYRTELVFVPEQKVEGLVDAGDLAGDIAAWPTNSERDDRFYTAPYLYNHLVFVKRSNDPFHYESDGQLRQTLVKGAYRLGLYSEVDYGPKVNGMLNLFVVSQRDYCSQLVRDVANKSLDLALVDQWAGAMELRSGTNFSSTLTLDERPLVERSLHVTIARSAAGAEQLVEAFNAGLDMIQRDGTYESLLKQYNYPQ
ncbi:ABC transporter substrate-binding protein [Thalassolituus sp. LLYu03]|uniref:ABC transporter substrate-binding protein n=1 Tax=Thalassolituus sp. LLYu03 TaxID=3421656 RepID=UPI003D29A32C